MGSVEWMFLFLYGGNFVFDCCLYLSFRGLIPVGLDREIPLYVFACVQCVCVCEVERERLMVGSTSLLSYSCSSAD